MTMEEMMPLRLSEKVVGGEPRLSKSMKITCNNRLRRKFLTPLFSFGVVAACCLVLLVLCRGLLEEVVFDVCVGGQLNRIVLCTMQHIGCQVWYANSVAVVTIMAKTLSYQPVRTVLVLRLFVCLSTLRLPTYILST